MTQEKATMIVPLLGPLPALPALLPSSRYKMLHNFHVLPKDQSDRNIIKLLTECIYAFIKSHVYLLALNGNYKLPQSSCEIQSTELPHKSQVKSSPQNPLE